MNELNNALQRDLTQMAQLKKDLDGVEELLEERPVDTNNIIGTMERREQQMDELQQILPKLSMYDT